MVKCQPDVPLLSNLFVGLDPSSRKHSLVGWHQSERSSERLVRREDKFEWVKAENAPEGMKTTGHSRPLAEWMVLMVTF